MHKSISDIISGTVVVSVKPSDSVRQAAQAMYEMDVGAVAVLEGGRLCGIFTERDALRFFATTRRNPYTINVEVVMTRNPVTIAADTTPDEARNIMISNGFRHLPVLQDDTVVGMVSLRGLEMDSKWLG